MPTIEHTQCCGIKEIDGVEGSHPKEFLLDIADAIMSGAEDAAFYFFSDIGDAQNGKAIAAFLKRNKLGKITKTGAKRNPNSGNRLHMWVWNIDLKAYRTWVHKTDSNLYKEIKENMGNIF